MPGKPDVGKRFQSTPCASGGKQQFDPLHLAGKFEAEPVALVVGEPTARLQKHGHAIAADPVIPALKIMRGGYPSG